MVAACHENESHGHNLLARARSHQKLQYSSVWPLEITERDKGALVYKAFFPVFAIQSHRKNPVL